MKNCNVSHSKESGLSVRGGGLMTIHGNATAIHHNCTDGISDRYGLNTSGLFSHGSIHLSSSLTIETISKNNGGGGNYGGDGGGGVGGGGAAQQRYFVRAQIRCLSFDTCRLLTKFGAPLLHIGIGGGDWQQHIPHCFSVVLHGRYLQNTMQMNTQLNQ